ncbi:MAG: hypothetical protein ACKOUK_02720 [Verrucomicrobiota bacterium]
MRAPLLLAACLSLAAGPKGLAIVIYGTTGLDHGADPGEGLPWANVGSLNGATGVYLGVYGGVPWALTAAHVGAGTLLLDSGSFAAAGPAIVIQNPNGSATDLAAFPLSTTPLLPNLSLASAAPAANSNVLLIGNGSRETGSLLYWKVTVDPDGPGSSDTWTTLATAEGSNRSGYALGGSGKRWGEALYTSTFDYTLGSVTQTGVATLFVGATGSSQAAGGDSGGAIFFHNGTSWGLLGIISAVGTLENQPANTAVTFNQTLSVSLPAYQTALLAAIPEPGHYALGAGALSLLAVLWHRRRSHRR